MKKALIICIFTALFVFIVSGNKNTDAKSWPSRLNTTRVEFLSSAYAPGEKNYAEWAADQLAQLKVGVTLGEWKSSHPDEKTEKVSPSGITPRFELWGAWCARTENRLLLPDGNEAIRYAFFYCPYPTSSLKLPLDQDSENLLDRCVLGLIWITGPTGVSNGNLLTQDASRVIGARFGNPDKNILVRFSGAFYWKEISRWRVGQATFVSAYDTYNSLPLALGLVPSTGFFMYGPGQDIEDYFAKETNKRAKAASRIRDAMITAGIEGPPRESMEELLKLNESWQKSLKPDKSLMAPERVVQTLGDWLAKTDSLSPLQKAAALLAADQVLNEVQHSFRVSDYQEGAATREALSKRGAEFNESILAGGIQYTQSWLSAAQRMDPDGPVGDLAFRILMEKGFDTSGTCRGGSRQYEKVIEEGEKYLKKPFDSAAGQAVELMVAEAYRDIVGLAEGLGREYADPQDYKDAAPEARRKAIEHYRAALSQAPDTVENRADWSDAWRLIAGLPPAHIRFYCIYD